MAAIVSVVGIGAIAQPPRAVASSSSSSSSYYLPVVYPLCTPSSSSSSSSSRSDSARLSTKNDLAVRRRTKLSRGGGGRAAGLRCRAMAGDEDSIEAIEKRLKGKRGKSKERYFDSYPTKPANADYPPGLWESDPATWDAKGGLEKAWLAWSGEPGFLWWMNKGAFWGAAALAFTWVLFRLVGPALGLYQLN